MLWELLTYTAEHVPSPRAPRGKAGDNLRSIVALHPPSSKVFGLPASLFVAAHLFGRDQNAALAFGGSASRLLMTIHEVRCCARAASDLTRASRTRRSLDARSLQSSGSSAALPPFCGSTPGCATPVTGTSLARVLCAAHHSLCVFSPVTLRTRSWPIACAHDLACVRHAPFHRGPSGPLLGHALRLIRGRVCAVSCLWHAYAMHPFTMARRARSQAMRSGP